MYPYLLYLSTIALVVFCFYCGWSSLKESDPEIRAGAFSDLKRLARRYKLLTLRFFCKKLNRPTSRISSWCNNLLRYHVRIDQELASITNHTESDKVGSVVEYVRQNSV